MSKSLGNSPDPVDLMEKYGADGLRFGLMRIAPVGSDVRFDETSIEEGRNFANKLYNACRFRQMAGDSGGLALPERSTGILPVLEDSASSLSAHETPGWKPVVHDRQDACLPLISPVLAEVAGLQQNSLPPYHLDIIAKLDALAAGLEESYAEYRFGEIAQRLYEFLWSEFCDKFLEAVKLDLRESATAEARAATLGTFDAVMSRYLQLMSPYMPHITEELSARMGYLREGAFLMQQPLPATPLLTVDATAAQARAAAIYEAAGRMRNLKAEYRMGSRKDVSFVIKSAPAWLAEEAKVLALLVGAADIRLDSTYEAVKGTPAAVTPLGEVYLPLEGLIDVAAERVRLSKEMERIGLEVKKCEGKLGNASFVERAPPEVVVQETARLADWHAKLQQLGEMLAALT